MKLDNMFKKTRIVSRIQSHSAVRASRPEVPEGLLRKCNKCGAAIIAEDVNRDIISVRNAEDISVYMHIAESRW